MPTDLSSVSDWLFAGAEDHPPHQNTIGHQWRTTLRKAGLTGIRLNDLRHFYASGLIADGCDVVTVQRARTRQGEHHARHLRQALALR